MEGELPMDEAKHRVAIWEEAEHLPFGLSLWGQPVTTGQVFWL